MLIEFDGRNGRIALDRDRITGVSESRLPSDFPCRVLVDYGDGGYDVRGDFRSTCARIASEPKTKRN